MNLNRERNLWNLEYVAARRIELPDSLASPVLMFRIKTWRPIETGFRTNFGPKLSWQWAVFGALVKQGQ